MAEPSDQNPIASKAPSMADVSRKRDQPEPSEANPDASELNPKATKDSKDSSMEVASKNPAESQTSDRNLDLSKHHPEASQDSSMADKAFKLPYMMLPSSGKTPDPSPSKEKPQTSKNPSEIDIVKAEASGKNVGNSFCLKQMPARKLNDAIKALTVRDAFNKKGTAMIEVGQNGVEITVYSSQHNVSGCLRLNVLSEAKFQFFKPLNRKIINLNSISRCLDAASDKDTVTVYHKDDSNVISINFGCKTFDVKLLEASPEFEKFPCTTVACECDLLNEQLKKFLKKLQHTKSKLVTADISDKSVVMIPGLDALEHRYSTRTDGIRKMEQGQTHHATFHWHHCESLKKASKLDERVIFGLVTEPKGSILWRFNLRELGDLTYIKKTESFILNKQN